MPMAPEEFCPVDAGCTVLAGKWRSRILWKLYRYEVVRYTQFRRELTGITDKMLAQQLRALEREGLVARTVHPEVPPRVEYRFTEFGRSLVPVLEALDHWSRAHEPGIRAAFGDRLRKVPAPG